MKQGGYWGGIVFPYQLFIRSGMPSVGAIIVGRRVRAGLEEPGGSNAYCMQNQDVLNSRGHLMVVRLASNA